MLWHCSTEELQVERARCKRKLREARKNIFINTPVFWCAAGAGLLLTMATSGFAFRPENSYYLLAAIIGGVVIPGYWSQRVAAREGVIVHHYRTRLQLIDLILRDRD